MTIKPRQMLVASSKYGIKCPYAMTAKYITVHNTANDASANNEISYMINNNSNTSYHFAVDDKEVVQGLPLNRNGFHAGDGANGTGNRQTIGIEICYSKSGGDRFTKAEQLAAKFIAQLLKERGWGIDRVKKHQDWSGKYCPHRTLDMGWQRFINMVSAELAPKAAKLDWVRFDKMKKYKTKLQPTHLWGIDCTSFDKVKDVKQFNKGEVIEIVGSVYNASLKATYLVTDYSFDKKIANGFNVVDMEEVIEVPAPAPKPAPKFVWVDLEKPLELFTNNSAKLVDLDTGKVQQTYTANTKIRLVQTMEYDNKTWYRTAYSTDKGFNWAFESTMFVVQKEPTQPEPSAPSLTPDVPVISQPEPSNSGVASPEENKNETKPEVPQDGSDSPDKNFVISILTKIVEFIKHIINLITKKGE